MDRAMIQPNPTRDNALRVSRELVRVLREAGLAVCVLEEFREVLLPGLAPVDAAWVDRRPFTKSPFWGSIAAPSAL